MLYTYNEILYKQGVLYESILPCLRIWGHEKTFVYMNGGSVRKGKPHDSAKQNQYVCSFCFEHLEQFHSTSVVHMIETWIQCNLKGNIKINNIIPWEFISTAKDFLRNRIMVSPDESHRRQPWDCISIIKEFSKNLTTM